MPYFSLYFFQLQLLDCKSIHPILFLTRRDNFMKIRTNVTIVQNMRVIYTILLSLLIGSHIWSHIHFFNFVCFSSVREIHKKKKKNTFSCFWRYFSHIVRFIYHIKEYFFSHWLHFKIYHKIQNIGTEMDLIRIDRITLIKFEE